MALAGYVGCGVGHKYPTDPNVLRPALELRGLRISEPWIREATILVAPISWFPSWVARSTHCLSRCFPALTSMMSSGSGWCKVCTKPSERRRCATQALLPSASRHGRIEDGSYPSPVGYDRAENLVDRIHSEGLSFQQGIEAGILTVPGDGNITTFPRFYRLSQTLVLQAGFAWRPSKTRRKPAYCNMPKWAALTCASFWDGNHAAVYSFQPLHVYRQRSAAG